ncbi:LuxR C-terminal-related transcriptional regulator [Paenibacillaceae bacterium WGS1546]|uniref:helix-turn-helix transcriptional regulator n=1 Tax=Cohnella sp. WGS1546 TaxID=3366810 RepID=UPI00372D10E2
MIREELADNALAQTPVAAAKLTVSRTAALTLARNRLIDRIQESLRNKAVLLCAPAGFGKSVLLQQWAEQAAEQPAWFSVDRSDNDIARFWHHTIRAIDFVRPGFKERAGDVARLFRLHPSRPKAALSPLLSELRQLQRPLVVVLDDFHAITNSALLTSFSYFLEHLPDRVHLILSGRTWPAIPCPPHGGTIERIGAEELRFTERESADFLSKVMAIHLSREEKDRWVRRTEGWAAAMMLAALPVRRESPTAAPPVHPFFGGSHLLEQYILEEVLGQHSEPIQRFLLDCSILKRMNASLCEAVSGNAASGAILERLEGEQLFIIALDKRKEWFRFGHLFAEFLRQRLERLEPERASKLLEAAGRWCEQEGWKEEALDYYLTGKHDDRAIRLLEGMASETFRENLRWLRSKFALIPETILQQHPILYVSSIYALLQEEKEYVRADRLMRWAERNFEPALAERAEAGSHDFGASYYFVKMLCELVVRGNPENGRECLRLAQRYGPSGVKLVLAQSDGSGLPSVLREHTFPERVMPKEMLLPFLHSLSELLEGTGLEASVIACLAEWHYELNELDEANRAAARAIKAAELSRSPAAEALLPARLVLSRVQRMQGLRDGARKTLLAARSDMIERGMTEALMVCDAEFALFMLEEGASAPAAAWMKGYYLNEADEIRSSRLYEHMYLAKLLLKQEEYERAWRLTSRLRDAADRDRRLYMRLDIELMQSLLLFCYKGRTEEAIVRLKHALSMTESGGYIRSYLDCGERLADLLSLLLRSEALEAGGDAPSTEYVRRLLIAFGRIVPPDDALAELKSTLTRKELEVFRLLVRRRTNREIADRLGISIGTVKSYINNLYSKLYVGSRSEAIRKGEQLGI